MSFNWKIEKLGSDPSNGIVYSVDWTLCYVDSSGADHFIGGSESFNPDPNGILIPYSDLTEDEVLSWVKDRVDGVSMEQNLSARAAKQELNPEIPWS